jgi:uroporphyrinogen-III synthase
MNKQPLAGAILITPGPRAVRRNLSRLRDLGAEVIEFPTIEIVLRWVGRIDQAIDRLQSMNWVIFTSVMGSIFLATFNREKEKASNPFL